MEAFITKELLYAVAFLGFVTSFYVTILITEDYIRKVKLQRRFVYKDRAFKGLIFKDQWRQSGECHNFFVHNLKKNTEETIELVKEVA